MGRPIRNYEAYEKAQEKRRKAQNKRIDIAGRNIPNVLMKHFDGKLEAPTLDQAINALIASGTGGALKSARRIARALKYQQHQDLPRLTRDEQRRRDIAAASVQAALTQLQRAEAITIINGDKHAVIALTSDLPAPELDIDERFDPYFYVRSGAAKVSEFVFDGAR